MGINMNKILFIGLVMGLTFGAVNVNAELNLTESIQDNWIVGDTEYCTMYPDAEVCVDVVGVEPVYGYGGAYGRGFRGHEGREHHERGGEHRGDHGGHGHR